MSALSTQHSALSTQHSALSTQHLIKQLWLYSLWLFVSVFSVEAGSQTVNCRNGPPGPYSRIIWQTAMGNWGVPFEDMFYFSPEELCNRPVMIRFSVNTFGGAPRAGVTYGNFGDGIAACNWSQPTSVPPETTGLRLQCLYADFFPPVSSQTLTLTAVPQTPPDPRPKGSEGKDGKSTLDLIAKVMEGSTPKAGVAVTFAVEVEPNSGGHDHHDASRPKGLVNGKLTASGVTEANGEIKVTFQASEFSGTHVVAAVCDTCTNKSVTKNVDVKVPGLSPLGHDMGPPQFIYWGSTPKHFSNHWFTIPAKISLAKLVEALVSFEWFPIGINDGSLKWGGSFDVPGHWAVGTNHDEHRIGEEVDISFVMGTNAKKITRSYYELCRDKKIDIPSTILWHDVPISEGGKYAPHFHVRLNGAYTLGARTGKPAGCSRDSEK